MVRVLKERIVDGLRYVKAAGLSTDTKPTADIMTGSSFVEVDTGKLYYYDEDGATWHCAV